MFNGRSVSEVEFGTIVGYVEGIARVFGKKLDEPFSLDRVFENKKRRAAARVSYEGAGGP